MELHPQDFKTLALSAAIAWGVVETIKPALKLANIEPRSPRHTLAVRLSALIIGATVGAILHHHLEGSGGSVAGGGLGAAAGALNAAIVAKIKAHLKERS